MDIMSILEPMMSIGGLGVVFGAGLGVAGEVFKVYEDPKVTAIMGVLPGANCGGCGFPGCGGLANAIAGGSAPVTACPVGGGDCAAAIADIMGVEADSGDPITAYIKCAGTCDNAKEQYEYFGIQDCAMAMQLAGGGSKTCAYGCLGLGSCKQSCGFGAIEIVNGIAVINPEKCVSCSQCVTACPKNLIEMLPTKNPIKIDCSSKAKGKVVMDACKVGCISCTKCVKVCKFDAIEMVDSLPVIDYAKCKKCRMCADACPKDVITGKRPPKPAPAGGATPAPAPAKPAEAPKAEAKPAEAPKE